MRWQELHQKLLIGDCPSYVVTLNVRCRNWYNDSAKRSDKLCKYPPAKPVALRLLGPQRGLAATVEK